MPLAKAMVFPVVMYGCESWTIKKAEHQRIDDFELWYWRRLLKESLGLQGDPSSPIISWQIDGETMGTVRGFILEGSKITADGDCSHEIKRCLLLGRKAMTNLDSILKSRDITLLTKVCLFKADGHICI